MNWKKIIFRTGAIILGLFAIGVAARGPYVIDTEKTAEAVAKIHATKLTMADVIGENLLPETDTGLKDATIAGIDANQNGIRDDVELAIFKEYPNSAKTRAVLLQYALALQMEFIQPIVNKETVTEIVREQSRAYACVGEILSRDDMKIYIENGSRLRLFVKSRQLNTDFRKVARDNFLENIGSYSPLNQVCDIDYSKLPN